MERQDLEDLRRLASCIAEHVAGRHGSGVSTFVLNYQKRLYVQIMVNSEYASDATEWLKSNIGCRRAASEDSSSFPFQMLTHLWSFSPREVEASYTLPN